MRRSWRFGAGAAAVMALAAVAAADSLNKSLVIIMDGVRSDALIAADMPNLDSLIAGQFGGGTYHCSYAYTAQTQQNPTVGLTTVEGGFTIQTGVGFDKLVANGYNGAPFPHYMATLESVNPSLNTAYITNPNTEMIDYRPSGPLTDDQEAAMVAGILSGTHADVGWAAGTDPDALFVWLNDPDESGHPYGFAPNVPQYVASIHNEDARIGQMLTAMRNRPNFANENWQIIISTDHGGEGNTHGSHTPGNETIPLIVASKTAAQGQMSGSPIQQDISATVIAHMVGAGAIPAVNEGTVRGGSVQPAATSLKDGLKVYLRFEGNYDDTSGRGNNADVGANAYWSPLFSRTGGKFGKFVRIDNYGGGETNSEYVTLGNPADLIFGPGDSFTLATWFRPHTTTNGAVLMGNRLASAVTDEGIRFNLSQSDGVGGGMGMTVGNGTTARAVGAVPLTANEWWFVATTFDRTGNVTMHLGNSTGAMWVLTDFASDLGDINSALPWNIGQDGSGVYTKNYDGDVDDFAVWSRVLSLAEIQTLYNNGAGAELVRFIFLPGDANKDGTVDLQDFGALEDNFGVTVATSWEKGDFNGDGVVDLQDFGILKDHFGAVGSPETAVPEPATLLLAGAGIAAILRRRRA